MDILFISGLEVLIIFYRVLFLNWRRRDDRDDDATGTTADDL